MDRYEWELEVEVAEMDRAVRILPGVKDSIRCSRSIPGGRYAIAASMGEEVAVPEGRHESREASSLVSDDSA